LHGYGGFRLRHKRLAVSRKCESLQVKSPNIGLIDVLTPLAQRLSSFLGCITVTDAAGVAWSIYHDPEPCDAAKRLNQSRCRLGCGLRLAKGTWGQDPAHAKGQFWGESWGNGPIANIWTPCHELCKNGPS